MCGLIISAVMAFWVGVGGTVLLPVPPIYHVSTEMCSIIKNNCSTSSNSSLYGGATSTIPTTTQVPTDIDNDL